MSGLRGNLALAALSLLLFLGACEGLARWVDLRPAAGTALANPPWLGDRWMLRASYRDEMAQAGQLARYYELYQWDRFLFFRLRPDAHLSLVDVFAAPEARERTRWSVHTNARGFRGAEFAAAPEPRRTRIAVLGDSSTFGWGVEQFEAYPERLGPALAALGDLPDDQFEVLNLGVPGYSSFQGRVLLEHVALKLAPDVVVWSFLSNDGLATGESDRAAYAQRSGAMGALLEWLHRSRAFEALEAWAAVARARLEPAAPPDPNDPGQRNVASYADAARNVRDAVAAARDAGVPIVLLAQCVRGLPARVLADVAAETGVPFLDATALLDAWIPRLMGDPERRGERERIAARYGREALRTTPQLLAFLPDACHPNPLGHRLVARALAPLVAAALEGGSTPRASGR
ncbi:MAG: SGNH/GDSL hydrolase family protein [Myxococcota bacterium]|nr:SGNH/GDSL hydrolase family protein [Myxococcota bacterium]